MLFALYLHKCIGARYDIFMRITVIEGTEMQQRNPYGFLFKFIYVFLKYFKHAPHNFIIRPSDIIVTSSNYYVLQP